MITSKNNPIDFSTKATRQFWISLGVGDAIAAMEETESWVVDGAEEVELLLLKLQDSLSSADHSTVAESIIAVGSSVVDFMGFLKSGRALLFFRWLSDVDPKIASILISEARSSGSDFGVILIERLRVLERQHMLSRIFSPERIAFVLECMHDEDDDD